MTLRSRVGGMVMGLSLVAALGGLPSLAQDPAKDAPKTDPAASRNVRRVPPHFGQVGVTPEQKEQVYAIRAKHQVKIDDLKRRLKEEEANQLAECEAVLLDSQRKVLVQLRAEAKTKAQARTKDRAEAARAKAKTDQ